jgi:outer membrane protein with beta-barrel domain
MRVKLIPLVLGAAVAALLLVQPAAAQGTDKGDVSFGYQFLSLSASGDTESMPAGWFVDVAGNLNRSVAVVAQVGGNYKSLSESVAAGGVTASANADVRVHQFMGGVRASAHPSTSVVPFVHILAGATYGSVSYSGTGSFGGQTVYAVSGADSGTNFALQAGGGTNIWMTQTVGLRIGVDYVRIFESDGGANVFRFGAGVGFKF